MQKAQRACIEFSLKWQSKYAYHKDRTFVDKVSFWRDIFPCNMEQHTRELNPVEYYMEHFEPGNLIPAFEQCK